MRTTGKERENETDEGGQSPSAGLGGCEDH